VGGTDGSTARAVALVRQWDSKADAIGLGVLKDRYRAGSHRFVEKDSAKLKAVAKQALTTIGGRLGDILQEWSVRHAQIQLGNYFNNARVVFLSGMTNYKLAMSMAEYTDNVMFADPLLQLGVPKFLTSIEALQLYSTGAHYVKDWSLPVDLATGPIKEWTRFVLRKAVQVAHRRRGRGLADLRGRHAQGNAAVSRSPEFTYRPPAARREDRREGAWARRSWAWAPSPRWWATPA
jgi:hypothetical protein